MRAHDPKRSISFLQTGQSAKPRFCELEFSEAAVGDLTQPANCCHSNISGSCYLYDRCTSQPVGRGIPAPRPLPICLG